MKRKHLAHAMGAATLLGASLATPAFATTLVTDGTIDQHVSLADAAVRDGALLSVVRNHSDKRVDAVTLLVRYDWLWKDELNPGPDSPGWSEYVTLDNDIEAGASVPFTYRPGTPLPARTDGQFLPRVELVGVRLYE